MKRIAYIPARSGSKGIPMKNIRELCGKPLLGWMVQAAVDTGIFDRVMVSTDSERFAEIARDCGAWVPFLRDTAAAQDATPSIVAVCSDKNRLESMGETFDTFCMLQPTSPLCRSIDISNAVAMFEEKGAGVVSVKASAARPSLLRKVTKDARAYPILDSSILLRRQDEDCVCEINGAIYVNKWSELTSTLKQAYNPYAYLMDEISSVDIDTLDDFEKARSLMNIRLAEIIKGGLK